MLIGISRSGLSIAASPASLRLLVQELGRGAEYAPPAGRVRLNTPAGRGLKNPTQVAFSEEPTSSGGMAPPDRP